MEYKVKMLESCNSEDNPFIKLSSYFLTENNITEKSKYSVFEIEARELITAERIDLMAKWLYIDAKETGFGIDYAREIYTRHIAAFSNGKFREAGDDYKISIQRYFEVFDNLILDIKNNGFNKEKSLIPIGDNNVILDGAHRCSIAAYYGKTVYVIKFEGLKRNYDYNYFLSNLLNMKYVKRMIYQYSLITSRNLYCACFWPSSWDKEKQKQSLELMKIKGRIVYQENIKINFRGLYNFIAQVYSDEIWVGDYSNKYIGARAKAVDCYKRNAPLKIVLFEYDSLMDVRLLKDKIRDIFLLGNNSIHTTDTNEETVKLVRLLLNNNSLHHLCYGVNDKYSNINEIIKYIKKNINDYGSFILLEDATLAIYGISDSKKYKYMGAMNLEKLIKCPIDYEILSNTDCFFYFNDIKFLCLNYVKWFKQKKSLCIIFKVVKFVLKNKLNDFKNWIWRKSRENNITIDNIRHVILKTLIFLCQKIGVYKIIKKIKKD